MFGELFGPIDLLEFSTPCSSSSRILGGTRILMLGLPILSVFQIKVFSFWALQYPELLIVKFTELSRPGPRHGSIGQAVLPASGRWGHGYFQGVRKIHNPTVGSGMKDSTLGRCCLLLRGTDQSTSLLGAGRGVALKSQQMSSRIHFGEFLP